MHALNNLFFQHFGVAPLAIASAPGRVNLIGEHTDYNQGLVLPMPIEFYTHVAVGHRNDNQIVAIAHDYVNEVDQFHLDQEIVHEPNKPWANYLRGLIKVMQALGHRFTGLNLAISGNVPQGAGLSSSASFEIALARAFEAVFHFGLTAKQMALYGQTTENQFVGCNCGIMDQLVSAVGDAGQALFIDCRDLSTASYALPSDACVLIVHSGVKRGLVDSEYNQRRLQCETVAGYFKLPSLRDLSVATLFAHQSRLDPVEYQRAQHVVTENQRVLDFINALSGADYHAMGQLMAASHASLRDDFSVSTKEVDHLVDIMQSAIGVEGGARMTGGGFGGCCVAIFPKAKLAQVVDDIKHHYIPPDGGPLRLFKV